MSSADIDPLRALAALDDDSTPVAKPAARFAAATAPKAVEVEDTAALLKKADAAANVVGDVDLFGEGRRKKAGVNRSSALFGDDDDDADAEKALAAEVARFRLEREGEIRAMQASHAREDAQAIADARAKSAAKQAAAGDAEAAVAAASAATTATAKADDADDAAGDAEEEDAFFGKTKPVLVVAQPRRAQMSSLFDDDDDDENDAKPAAATARARAPLAAASAALDGSRSLAGVYVPAGAAEMRGDDDKAVAVDAAETATALRAAEESDDLGRFSKPAPTPAQTQEPATVGKHKPAAAKSAAAVDDDLFAMLGGGGGGSGGAGAAAGAEDDGFDFAAYIQKESGNASTSLFD